MRKEDTEKLRLTSSPPPLQVKHMHSSWTAAFVAILISVCLSIQLHDQRREIAGIREELKEQKALWVESAKSISDSSADERLLRSYTTADTNFNYADADNVIATSISKEDRTTHRESGNSSNIRPVPVVPVAQKYKENENGREIGRYLVVKGLAGDGQTDDTAIIQKAINKAANNRSRATVVLPRGIFLITKTIRVKAGVTLVGQGYGSSPLQIKFDASGSVLAYCGDKYAVKLAGHGASLEKLAVYDYPVGSECESKQGLGGVLISANNQLVESITMRNVLIYQFMGGASIKVQAINAGGIAYASFHDIRIRNAKVGIHLSADDTSFVNSNKFYDGAISGGITDIGIWAEGPGACNDNQFNSMVIEPYSTNITHVYISGSSTNVRMNDVRLEGKDMFADDKPLVIIEDESYGNVMNGMLGHTNVKADLNRNPGITFATNKMVSVKSSGHNLLWNAAFHGFDPETSELPGWTMTGASVDVKLVPDTEEDHLYVYHNIIGITYLGSGDTFKLRPASLQENHIDSFCTFGIYAKSDVAGSISAPMKDRSGSTIASSSHSGSGKWEFIGMSSLYDRANGPQAYFSITGDVKVTAPTFVYGSASATPGAEFLSGAGARMSGLFTSNIIEVSPPDITTDQWFIPVEGNIYDTQQFPDSGGGTCSTTYQSVRRINHSNPKFPKGSIVTIMFPVCGNCVPCLAIRHNTYIQLMGESDFVPQPLGINSMTLVSNGNGTWREVSRNGA